MRQPRGYRSRKSESLSGVLGRSARGGAQGSGLQVETTHDELGGVRAGDQPRTESSERGADEIEDFAAPADRQLGGKHVELAEGKRTDWRASICAVRWGPGQPSDLPSEAISTISGWKAAMGSARSDWSASTSSMSL